MNIFFDFYDKKYNHLLGAFSFSYKDNINLFYYSSVKENWLRNRFKLCPDFAWDIQEKLDLG